MKYFISFTWWLYLAAVFYLVFMGDERQVSLSLLQRINLAPGRNIVIFYRTNPHTGRFYTILLMEIFGNLFLLLPFGFLMALSYPNMKIKKIILYGLLLSAGIELTQLFLQIGIFDTGDLILNVIGVAAGAALYNLVKKNLYRGRYLSNHR